MSKKMLFELIDTLGVRDQIGVLETIPHDMAWMMIVDLVKEEWEENDGSIDHLLEMGIDADDRYEGCFAFVNDLITSRGGHPLKIPQNHDNFDDEKFDRILADLIKLVLFVCKPLFYPKQEGVDEKPSSDTEDEANDNNDDDDE